MAWSEELHQLILAGWHDISDLYSCSFAETEHELQEEVQQHFNFLVRLLKMRTQTLCCLYLLPPYSFAGLLVDHLEQETSATMDQQWELVLRAEADAAAGAQVLSLKNMHWRLNTVYRLVHCLNQRARRLQLAPAEARHLVWRCVEHLGDSAIVENTHQIAKARSRIFRKHLEWPC